MKALFFLLNSKGHFSPLMLKKKHQQSEDTKTSLKTNAGPSFPSFTISF